MEVTKLLLNNVETLSLTIYLLVSIWVTIKSRLLRKAILERLDNMENFIYAMSISSSQPEIERLLINTHRQLVTHYYSCIVKKVNILGEPDTSRVNIAQLLSMYARFVAEFHVSDVNDATVIKMGYQEIIAKHNAQLQIVTSSHQNLNASSLFITFYTLMMLDLNHLIIKKRR